MSKKIALQAELLKVKKQIKLFMNFRNYGDTLGNSKEEDKKNLAQLVLKQKELVNKIKKLSEEVTK
jgi:hypothetical protein